MRALGVVTGCIVGLAVVAGAPRTATAFGLGFSVGGSASGAVVVGGGAVALGGFVAGGVIVGGVVAVDDGFAEPPPYPVAYAPPPCECCGCQPVYAAPPVYPGTVVVASEHASPPIAVGVGLAATSTRVSGGAGGASDELDGGALLLRLRGEVLEVELEVGRDESSYDGRTDEWVGGALLVHALRSGRLSGYGLIGAGLIDARTPLDDGRSLGYGAIGAGLALRLGPVSLGADLRWQARRTLRERAGDVRVAGPDAGGGSAHAHERERGVAARLFGVVYF